MKSDMERWHREAAGVLGQMSIAIARARVRPAALAEWAGVLARVAEEVRAAAPAAPSLSKKRHPSRRASRA